MKFEIILHQHTPLIVEQITDVPAFIDNNKEMLQAFLKFAADQPNGVGLAANQVSLNGERLMHRFFAAKNIKYGNWGLFVMPEITPFGMLETKIEGCLTYPGKSIIAKRHRACNMLYYNEHKTLVPETFIGFNAQIMQHECNHLNGYEEEVVDRLDQHHASLIERRNTRPNRNDSCPCGSLEKYKNCCLKLI